MIGVRTKFHCSLKQKKNDYRESDDTNDVSSGHLINCENHCHIIIIITILIQL